jgi:hypothetical protein
MLFLQGEGDRFSVNGAGARNGPAGSAAFFDVQPNGFEDAAFGFFDRVPDSVYAGEIFAVGPVLAPFAFDGDGVCEDLHRPNNITE